jgi:hypothetical protein
MGCVALGKWDEVKRWARVTARSIARRMRS